MNCFNHGNGCCDGFAPNFPLYAPNIHFLYNSTAKKSCQQKGNLKILVIQKFRYDKIAFIIYIFIDSKQNISYYFFELQLIYSEMEE